MSWTQMSPQGSKQTNTSATYHAQTTKPIEIYIFIDPLCPISWDLEPYLHKLYLEYGRFFTYRRITCSYLNKGSYRKYEKRKLVDVRDSQMKHCQYNSKLWNQCSILFPWVSIAIKAAELQGHRLAKKFIRRIQEYYFVHHIDVTNEHVIIQVAEEIGLDMDEFRKDLYSSTIKKAIERDLKIARDMDVDSTPSMVFFNQTNDSQGIKISGLYSYDIYVSILYELLGKKPIPSVKPDLEDFIAKNEFVTKKEVSIIYDWTPKETKRNIKQLQLMRKVKQFTINHHICYQYLD